MDIVLANENIVELDWIDIQIESHQRMCSTVT